MSRTFPLVAWVMAFLLGPGLEAGPQKASMTLSCLSLRVHPASFSQLGFTYRLGFTTSDDDSINHEMYRSGGTDEVGSTAILDYPGSEALGPILGNLQLKTPMAGDLDVNGITDFLQVDRAVAGLTTSGTLEVDDGMDISRGTVTAIWNRAAGSASGTVQVRVNLPDFSLQDLSFQHVFEIFQYTGTLTYEVVGTNIHASIDLPRVGSPASQGFQGPFPLGRIDPGTLARLAATWQGPGALDFQPIDTFGLEGLETPVHYIARDLYAGLVILADGDPSTPFMDEYEFFDLVIRDPNDSDGNGMPDLSDPSFPAPARPGIRISLVGGRMRASVTGPAGARCLVERAGALAGTPWTSVVEVTLDALGVAEADLGIAAGDAGFVRARMP